MDENNNQNKAYEQPEKDEIKVNENNSLNGTGDHPPKENPFKSWKFHVSFFITIVIFVAISWLLMGDGWIIGVLAAVSWLLMGGVSSGYLIIGVWIWMIVVLVLCIPYIIAGVIAWAIIRKKNRSIALGILFGSIAPFVVVFIVTGGCGLFML